MRDQLGRLPADRPPEHGAGADQDRRRTARPVPDRAQRSAALSAFWSGHQRFIKSSPRCRSPRSSRRSRVTGRSASRPSLQLVNTNEASQKGTRAPAPRKGISRPRYDAVRHGEAFEHRASRAPARMASQNSTPGLTAIEHGLTGARTRAGLFRPVVGGGIGAGAGTGAGAAIRGGAQPNTISKGLDVTPCDMERHSNTAPRARPRVWPAKTPRSGHERFAFAWPTPSTAT